MINVSHKVGGTEPPVFSWMDLHTPQEMINQCLPRAKGEKTFIFWGKYMTFVSFDSNEFPWRIADNN